MVPTDILANQHFDRMCEFSHALNLKVVLLTGKTKPKIKRQILLDLKNNKVEFIIEPTIRFKGEVGEQATMFLSDPSGNAIEFKSFKDEENLFRKD